MEGTCKKEHWIEKGADRRQQTADSPDSPDLTDPNVHLVAHGTPLGVVQVPKLLEHHQCGVCGVDGLELLLVTLWAFKEKVGEEMMASVCKVRRTACF
jgi:hypothetical protein